MDLEGKKPAPPPLYIVGRRMGAEHKPRRSPSPPQHLSSSVYAWRSPVGVLLHQLHHAVVLPLEQSSSTSPSPLLDQEGGDVSRPVRVLNAEVLSVQHLDIGDPNHVRVRLHHHHPLGKLPLVIYKWYVDANSLP